MRSIVYILLLNPAFPAAARAQEQLPQFEDYAIKEAYSGRVARPVLKTPRDKEFRTMLNDAARKRPNFAGHYIITMFGCGAQCVMGAALNATTGQVSWFPFTICCWGTKVPQDFEPVEYRRDSSLIVFKGARNEKGNGVYYYKFENHRFVPLREIEQQTVAQ